MGAALIYLAPEIKSGLGEDTFWTWFNREFESTFSLPAEMGPKDVLLQYSTLGPSRVKGGKKVALLWELHPEMLKQGVLVGYSDVLNRIMLCSQDSDVRTISSRFMTEFYGEAHELPIAVDSDLFKPMDKKAMRAKHNIPDGKVCFWGGSPHHMKGPDRLMKYARENPDVYFITAWKKQPAQAPKGKVVVRAPQQELAELMNCADYMLGTSRLRPFYMIEWEALCTGLPYLNISGLEKDFNPSPEPRNDVIQRGWTRKQAKQSWGEFLASS